MAMTNNGYSDLIHLFIDGEASEVERNTLFNALKDSPELQEEFSSAMRLKQAFAADIRQLQPPTYLQSQIAERAGIIVTAAASAANAPVVVNAVSNAVSNIAPVATGILSKGAITMLVGASVGILSTVGIFTLTSNSSNVKDMPVSSPAPVVRQIQKTLPPATIPAIIAPMEMTQGEYVERKPVKALQEESAVNNAVLVNNSNPASQNEIAAQQKNNPTLLNTSIAQTQADAGSGMNTINSVAVLTPKLNNIGGGDSHSSLHSLDRQNMGVSDIGKFSVRFTGITYSKLFQGSDMAFGWSKNLDWGIAAKYDLDPSNAIGVEVGNERFPVYLSNGDGGFEGHQAITWYGLSLTYTAVHLDFAGIHPEGRFALGYSSAGPIVKYSAGLNIPLPDYPNLNFSVDGEETMLFIQSNGANITGNKFGLTASATFHF